MRYGRFDGAGDSARRDTVEAGGRGGLSVAAFGLAALAVAAPAATGTEVDDAPPAVAGIVHVCSSCHGLRGNSISSMFPRLAGQPRDYLEAQLRAFRGHSRADPHAKTYMWGMAARLTDAQIAEIAGYYSALPPAGSEPDPSPQSAVGARIFIEGIASQDVPACAGCHGEKAEGKGAAPRLAGQHPAYLERQLEWYLSKARDNPVMYESTKNLTPEQIAAVTAYLATQ